VKHLNLTRRVPHPTLGEVEVIGQPIAMSRSQWSIRGATPEAGAHTDEILAGLGYDAGAIASLRSRKVV
jgi:crotonobetainyl-CoA:carnitine CoA-transferase CaiB-like acyl-CoA transferase